MLMCIVSLIKEGTFMNVIKRFSVMALTVMSMSLVAGNFDLVNSNPKTPVYYSINGVVKGIGGAHLRESRKVEVGKQLKITFSAKADCSNPTLFSFVPAQKTCFIQVHVGRDGKIIIEPQTAAQSTVGKQCSKAGCAVKAKQFSARNITQKEIDQIKAQSQAVPCAAAATPARSKRDAGMDTAIARSLKDQKKVVPASADYDLDLAIARSLEDQNQEAPAPALSYEEAAPAPDEDDDADMREAIARSLEDQNQEAPAPALSYEEAAPAPDEDDDADMRKAIALSLKDQKQAAPAPRPVVQQDPYAADMAAWQESEARNRASEAKEQDAQLPSYEEAFKLTTTAKADTAANAQPAPVVQQEPLDTKIVETDAIFQQTSDFADESSVAAPVTVEPAAPVAQSEQPAKPAEAVELAAAAAAPPAPEEAVDEEPEFEAPRAKPKFEDNAVEQLADGNLSVEQLATYRQAASNIIDFFHPTEVIGAWLNAAKKYNNIDELTKLIQNFMQPNKEEFEAAVKDIMKQVPNGILPGGRIPAQGCIDYIFENILPNVAPATHTAITACIVKLYGTQHEYLDEVNNLTELLAKWEAHLKRRAPMNTRAMWQQLDPLSKIYYLELIAFYFVAQSTLEGMAPAASQQ
jgi:hypothetical protein